MADKVKFHPLCMLYPDASGDDRARMAESIRSQGVIEPVTYWVNPETGDKEYLDGKNRIRISAELGLPFPPEQEFTTRDGHKPTWHDAADYITARNARRNIESGQLAILAVRMEKWLEREDKRRNPSAPRGKRRGKDSKAEVAAQGQAEGKEGKPEGSAEGNGAAGEKYVDPATEMAQRYGTNKQYLYHAEKVERTDKKLGDKVLKGEMTLSAALRQIKGQPESSPGRKPQVSRLTDEPVLDGHGKEVPKAFRRVFETRSDYDQAAKVLKQFRAIVKEIAEGPGSAHLDRAGVDGAVRKIGALLDDGRPLEVCPDCGGKRSLEKSGKVTKCERCAAAGYIGTGTINRRPGRKAEPATAGAE
jgi:hypothetical protein